MKDENNKGHFFMRIEKKDTYMCNQKNTLEFSWVLNKQIWHSTYLKQEGNSEKHTERFYVNESQNKDWMGNEKINIITNNKGWDVLDIYDPLSPKIT